MSRRLFDFKCEDNHYTELFIEETEKSAICKECGKEAKRVISPVSCVLDAISGDYPGATMKWARDHEKAANKRN